MLMVFWDMKRSITFDFLEKDVTVNSASFSQLLRQYSFYLLNEHCIKVKNTSKYNQDQ